MHAGAVVSRPEDATWTGVVVPWCPACWTPEAKPAALPAGSGVVEAPTWGTATAAWRMLPVPAEPACAHFDLGACARCSPAIDALGLATAAALAPWLGRHQTGDYRAYACLDADLDWLGQMNLLTLERNAGLVYSEYVIDGARVWIATELGGDTAVFAPWERQRTSC
jgi:hypothetical protein